MYDHIMMKLHYVWGKAPAYLVNMTTVCFGFSTKYSTTTPPEITVDVSSDNSSYTSVFSAIDVGTIANTTGAESVAGRYEVKGGEYIDFSLPYVGSRNASDATIKLTFILE